jgi:hypothetical protein
MAVYQSNQNGFTRVRRDQLYQESVHDTYKTKGKLPEPTICSDCGAVFHDGHWQWLPRPENPHETCCPACHRVRDHFPAGFVTLSGDRFEAHKAEIMALVQRHVAREKLEHPLQRIIAIEKARNSTVVTTTDIHLARGIGNALQHAYHGNLDFHYNPQQYLLRVGWIF